MKKIIAFAGSNSSTSINHKLVSCVASTINGCDVEVLQLTDFPLPIYSEDIEKNEEFPEPLTALLAKLKEADGLIISVNEHNGALSAFFKNTLDWLTRIELSFVENKQVLLLSTSPGKRGGKTSLEYLAGFLPRIKADVTDSIEFPSFHENFSVEESKIVNPELANKINDAVEKFVASL